MQVSNFNVSNVAWDRTFEAKPVLMILIGSVKWREQAPFDRRDLAELATHRTRVPGAADAALIAVSRAGCTARDVDRAYGPADLVAA